MSPRTTLAALAAIVLSSPFPAPAQDPGRIYVYAQRQTAARSWLMISCNGVAVAELKQGMLFAINVQPGRYTLSTEKGVPAFVTVRSAGEFFLRLDWNYELGRPAIPVLNTIPADQARKEMRFLNYVKPARVLSTLVPKTDPREPHQLQFKRREDQ